MSFQAYLDNLERKTGRTPRQLIEEATTKGLHAPETRAQAIVDWLQDDYGVGRGHAMALVHVIRNGPGIADTHVGSTGTHRDASNLLLLDGLANR